jgi:hypothetical protein
MSCVLQDDLKKFVSEPPPPPQEVEIPEGGKTKAKEWWEVGEGDDTVVVEDTSDEDDDEETLQDRFQLRSRFSCPGLPHVPLVQDPPASLVAPPRKPRNPARKRVTKKLKVYETTPKKVRRLEWCSRVLVSRVHLSMTKLPCLQEVPPTEPADQGDEGEWDTVGEPAGSRSPAPLLKSSWHRWSASPLLLKGARSAQPLLLKEWWPQERRRALHRLPLLAEEAAAAEAQEEAPAEAGLVDIASILGAPTVTIVRSSL